MSNRRKEFGRKKFGLLTKWAVFRIFDEYVLIGFLGAERFSASILCFDGVATDPTSFIWTDKGRVKITREDRVHLLGV